MKKLNISKAVVSRGASLLVVSVALVAAYIAISMNMTMGWFTKSNSVTANGMAVQVYDANFQVSYQRVDTNSPEVLTPNFLAGVKVPGQSIEFKVTVTNIGAYPANVNSVGLKLPTAAQDVPIYDPDLKVDRYLSTELTTHVLDATVSKFTEDNATVPTSTKVALKSNAEKQVLRDEDGVYAIDYFHWFADESSITLKTGESITFTIRMTFEDSVDDQNIYKNYAEKGGVCVREIYISYE